MTLPPKDVTHNGQELMPHHFPPDSVGLVTPQTLQFEEPLALDCGRSLAEYELDYETYGTLNAEHSNAVLIWHAISSDHHAAGCHEGRPSAAR